ncbi:bifunctional hydroxymethylpyrimidine kinase/phosphomethylpyrimidine kinase [Arthrobacter sp. NamB2]|uniref:bifunctional hydroxymethylpyrimidine kinase/phosphomethylpyrimidine kinase n=1 Tax=Arthrobacter sp. NamB2 TaxID=2576035 RepID=UPI0010C9FEDB|nr:bifunctional hydroxymethylpyrimidine kinase/phosphomethylpyrimidine kinase [Arthrobacter sp. NamB2]TKV28170.1 bifunctional hydroxymethylpyrimidine kinase/phosphomethylpyrimidine kinase [Arthrobacter sp. NamB2]
MDTVRAPGTKNSSRIPNVLSIAGSDPSGGAGVQADIKSISANGGYAMAVLTALTAQNTQGVSAVHTPPVAFLRQQLDAVAEDVAIDAVKIGMLGSADVARAVAEWLDDVRVPVVVLDPVMVATSGARLLDDDAVRAVVDLARRASLVTPNVPELAVLVGAEPATSWSDALEQGSVLAALLDTRVLVKGGHLPGERCPDALILPPGRPADAVAFDGVRITTANTHGTGCSLSSAIATRYAVTSDWPAAVREAKFWLEGALRAADHLEVGAGSGPVHHFHSAFHAAGTGSHERFTDLAWRRSTATRRHILDLPFVRALTDGSLSTADFAHYLQQDALYLREYCGVLARTAAMAPTDDEQLFWLSAATSCLRTEAELHRTWLDAAGLRFGEGEAGPATRAYCDHLTATAVRGSYAELVAAVLPCFWLYAAVGDWIQEQVRSPLEGSDTRHPYADWIATYADADFAAATERAKQISDEAHRRGSAAEREAMLAAFLRSAAYERDFFDAPRVQRLPAATREPADLREDAVLT